MLKRLLAVLTLGLLAVLATGCILSVEPEEAENPVGTEHTVTATLISLEEIDEEEFCDNFLDELEDYDPEDFNQDEFEVVSILILLCEGGLESAGLTDGVEAADHQLVNFDIIDGPNAGLNSDDDGVCEPSCDSPDVNDQVSWTYQSNGSAGTDVIEVCGEFLPEMPLPPSNDVSASQVFPPGYETVEELLLEVLNETLRTNNESFEDFFCQTVEKTWIAPSPTPEPTESALRPRPPNIGAGLSGLFAGQPTPLPTAAAPAPAAPSPVIRPPSTGDAGLAE